MCWCYRCSHSAVRAYFCSCCHIWNRTSVPWFAWQSPSVSVPFIIPESPSTPRTLLQTSPDLFSVGWYFTSWNVLRHSYNYCLFRMCNNKILCENRAFGGVSLLMSIFWKRKNKPVDRSKGWIGNFGMAYLRTFMFFGIFFQNIGGHWTSLELWSICSEWKVLFVWRIVKNDQTVNRYVWHDQFAQIFHCYNCHRRVANHTKSFF